MISYRELALAFNNDLDENLSWQLIDVASTCHLDISIDEMRDKLAELEGNTDYRANIIRMVEIFTATRDTHSGTCSCKVKGIMYFVSVSKIDHPRNLYLLLEDAMSHEMLLDTTRRINEQFEIISFNPEPASPLDVKLDFNLDELF